MKPKVLLIDPSIGYSEEGIWEKPTSPNLGLAYIRGFLKKECDVDVAIIEMSPSRLSLKDIKTLLMDYHPDIVGLTAKTFNIPVAYKVAKIIKETLPETIVILGGPHATALPAQTLKEALHLDAVIRREGEYTVKEIVERFSDGARNQELFSGVSGTTYRTVDGEVVHNGERELITDLDLLPFTDFSIYNLNAYRKVYNPSAHRLDMRFPVLSSRGCPYQCTFCMPLSRRVRYRSVPNVMKEIQLLLQQYNASFLYFEDASFGISGKWLEEFCQEFTHLGLHRNIKWGFETRVELFQSEDIAKMVKGAGCNYLSFGIESGSENVLHHANKRFTRDQVRNAVRLARKAGIDRVIANFIIGLPFETGESIKETIEFVRELALDVAGAGIVDIYPGTELYGMVERGEGGIRWLPGCRDNWETYSRSSCQTTVNELTEQDLLSALNQFYKVSYPLRGLLTPSNLRIRLQELWNDPNPKRLIERAKRAIALIK